MSRDDCKGKWVLRIGELHTVMAALRAIGTSIEGSGINDAWIEAGLYGPTTTRQILEANHMKRALRAHVITSQALFDLYVSGLVNKYPAEFQEISLIVKDLNGKFKDAQHNEVVNIHEGLIAAMERHDIQNKIKQYDANSRPMAKVMRSYIDAVLTLLAFIQASRDADWELHLSSLESLCHYFSAHDHLKYARLVPLYIAEMRNLEKTDPAIWEELKSGNCVANK